MGDREARLRERRARIDPDDPDAQLAALVAAARGGDPVAQLHLAMRRWLGAERPTPTDPEVQARCSDPAWGLAYDDERFGRMVYVPDHVALLGSREDDRAAYADETPQMAVAVPAFYVAQEPMTLDRWRALGRAYGGASPHGYVVSVSWDGVTAALGNAAEADGGPARVLRGGCWNLDASYCRAAFRNWDSPGNRRDYLGFRPARSAEADAEAPRVGRGGSLLSSATGARAAHRHRGPPGLRGSATSFRPAAGSRLPTEDEWEAAARGPLGSVYPWGDEWRPRAEYRLGPGGASWCGVQGMSGSVWQWTADAWSERRHPAQEGES